MTCPECGKEIKGYVCRDCQKVRTRHGMLLHQRRFIETWLAGSIDLRIKRKDSVRHLELFDDRWHSYCDIEMFEVTSREFTRTIPDDLCPACLKIFNELVVKAGSGAR
jgi:hypothetical protein